MKIKFDLRNGCISNVNRWEDLPHVIKLLPLTNIYYTTIYSIHLRVTYYIDTDIVCSRSGPTSIILNDLYDHLPKAIKMYRDRQIEQLI